VVAKGVALLHAARNRMGQPDATITLTERELRTEHTDTDSGVSPMLNFQIPKGAGLNLAKLTTLGFGCSVDSCAAPGRQRKVISRLVAIDAATDAPQLGVRYPDRHSILILHAVIRISILKTPWVTNIVTGVEPEASETGRPRQ
jgi:hypothetical protein